MRAIVLVPSPGDLRLVLHVGKGTAIFLNIQKKTLNNVKANVFGAKLFCLGSEHLIYIYARAKEKAGALTAPAWEGRLSLTDGFPQEKNNNN